MRFFTLKQTKPIKTTHSFLKEASEQLNNRHSKSHSGIRSPSWVAIGWQGGQCSTYCSPSVPQVPAPHLCAGSDSPRPFQNTRPRTCNEYTANGQTGSIYHMWPGAFSHTLFFPLYKGEKKMYITFWDFEKACFEKARIKTVISHKRSCSYCISIRSCLVAIILKTISNHCVNSKSSRMTASATGFRTDHLTLVKEEHSL